MDKTSKGNGSISRFILSFLSVVLAIAIPVLLVAEINGHIQAREKAAAIQKQELLSKMTPEERAAYQLMDTHDKRYVKDIVDAMKSINSGKQSQAVITGPLDNEILTFLSMNGFEVVNTYSTTNGYKYVSSTTHYVIQKKS